MVRVRSTAHFLVFMMGVSPTAFSRMSTAGKGARYRRRGRPAPPVSLAGAPSWPTGQRSCPSPHAHARPNGNFSPHYFSFSCRQPVPRRPASRLEGEPGQQPPLPVRFPGPPPHPHCGPRSAARRATAPAPPLPPCSFPSGGSDATRGSASRRFVPCGTPPSRQGAGRGAARHVRQEARAAFCRRRGARAPLLPPPRERGRGVGGHGRAPAGTGTARSSAAAAAAAAPRPTMIKAILIFNNHGKPRLSKFYQRYVRAGWGGGVAAAAAAGGGHPPTAAGTAAARPSGVRPCRGRPGRLRVAGCTAGAAARPAAARPGPAPRAGPAAGCSLPEAATWAEGVRKWRVLRPRQSRQRGERFRESCFSSQCSAFPREITCYRCRRGRRGAWLRSRLGSSLGALLRTLPRFSASLEQAGVSPRCGRSARTNREDEFYWSHRFHKQSLFLWRESEEYKNTADTKKKCKEVEK